MYKTGMLNSEISKILSDLGHTDRIVIADCGLPIPNGVKKIDLALEFGKPSFLEVYQLLKKHMAIESTIIAEEMMTHNKTLHEALTDDLPQVSYVTHENFKALTKEVKAIIRTGEATPYANIILQSDVIF